MKLWSAVQHGKEVDGKHIYCLINDLTGGHNLCLSYIHVGMYIYISWLQVKHTAFCMFHSYEITLHLPRYCLILILLSFSSVLVVKLTWNKLDE